MKELVPTTLSMPRFKATPQQLQWLPVEDDKEESESEKDDKVNDASTATDILSSFSVDKVSMEDLTALCDATHRLIAQLSVINDNENGITDSKSIPILSKLIPTSKAKITTPCEKKVNPPELNTPTFKVSVTPVDTPKDISVNPDERDSKLADSLSESTHRSRRYSKRVECEVCQKVIRRGSLREHMDRHNNSGKFPCSYCGKTFSRSGALEKHVRTHTGERPFKCELCPKAYRQRVHLKEHIRAHTGARPYVCRLCGINLASKSILNRHLRAHGVQRAADDVKDMWFKSTAPKDDVANITAEVGRTLATIKAVNELKHDADGTEEGVGKKPEELSATPAQDLTGAKCVTDVGRRFLCNSCPAVFPTAQSLRSHRVSAHGDLILHRCEDCDMSFTGRRTMENHLRVVHPIVCPICSKVMPERRRWMLEAHVRGTHPDVSVSDVLSQYATSSPITSCAPLAMGNRSGGSSTHGGQDSTIRRRRGQSGGQSSRSAAKRRRRRNSSSGNTSSASNSSDEEENSDDFRPAPSDSDGEFIEEDELSNESDEDNWGKCKRTSVSNSTPEPPRVQPTRIQPLRSSRQNSAVGSQSSLLSPSTKTVTVKSEAPERSSKPRSSGNFCDTVSVKKEAPDGDEPKTHEKQKARRRMENNISASSDATSVTPKLNDSQSGFTWVKVSDSLDFGETSLMSVHSEPLHNNVTNGSGGSKQSAHDRLSSQTSAVQVKSVESPPTTNGTSDELIESKFMHGFSEEGVDFDATNEPVEDLPPIITLAAQTEMSEPSDSCLDEQPGQETLDVADNFSLDGAPGRDSLSLGFPVDDKAATTENNVRHAYDDTPPDLAYSHRSLHMDSINLPLGYGAGHIPTDTGKTPADLHIDELPDEVIPLVTCSPQAVPSRKHSPIVSHRVDEARQHFVVENDIHPTYVREQSSIDQSHHLIPTHGSADSSPTVFLPDDGTGDQLHSSVDCPPPAGEDVTSEPTAVQEADPIDIGVE